MARAILSQDIVSICLVCTEGNLDTPIQAILDAVNAFEEEHGRFFGASFGDFPEVFLPFIFFGLEFRPSPVVNAKVKGMAIFQDLTLWHVLPDMLHYHHVYFNDEGASWTQLQEDVPLAEEEAFVEYWAGLSPAKYHQKKQLWHVWCDTFCPDDGFLAQETVQDLMATQDITPAILYACSSPG